MCSTRSIYKNARAPGFWFLLVASPRRLCACISVTGHFCVKLFGLTRPKHSAPTDILNGHHRVFETQKQLLDTRCNYPQSFLCSLLQTLTLAGVYTVHAQFSVQLIYIKTAVTAPFLDLFCCFSCAVTPGCLLVAMAVGNGEGPRVAIHNTSVVNVFPLHF